MEDCSIVGVGDKFFEPVEPFECLETTLTNQNSIH